MALPFAPLTPTSIGIYWPRPMHLCSLRAKGPWVVKLLIRTFFINKVNMTFTFDPKINRGYLQSKTNVPEVEGQSPISCRLLIGNHFDIQGQFDLDRKYPKTIEVIFWT
jgi:hypothetical protein